MYELRHDRVFIFANVIMSFGGGVYPPLNILTGRKAGACYAVEEKDEIKYINCFNAYGNDLFFYRSACFTE